MNLAPDWNVPEGVSPFTPLPVYDRCAHCRTPLGLDSMAVVAADGVLHSPLCTDCARTVRLRDALYMGHTEAERALLELPEERSGHAPT